MKQPAHTITLEPWRETSLGMRIAIQSMLILLSPLRDEDRISALISVLSDEILNIAQTDEQIDAVMDVIRMQLKMRLAQDSPPLQGE